MKLLKIRFFIFSFSDFLLVLFCLFVVQCSSDNISKDKAKLEFYDSGKKKSFSFVISDEFASEIKNSVADESFPKMKKLEMKLLIKLLKKSNYCRDDNGKLSFIVKTRQEKIYDVTFSSLVGQNYNIKPVSPVTYFGDCI